MRHAAISILAVAMLATGCSKSASEQASEQLAEAQTAYEAGDYAKALALIENLDSTYRAEVDVRRQAMHLKPQIIEKQTLEELSITDSLVVLAQLRGDSISKTMHYVSNPVEGYYVSTTEPKDINATTGLYARMSPDGHFYIVATNTRGGKSNAIRVFANGRTAETSHLPDDGERIDRSGKAEVLTFMQSECDSVGKLISQHKGVTMSFSFIGNGNGAPQNIEISGAQSQALGEVYDAAEMVREMKLLQIRKARLEKTLTTARNQAARTFQDSIK